jgi:hypothetical protein
MQVVSDKLTRDKDPEVDRLPRIESRHHVSSDQCSCMEWNGSPHYIAVKVIPIASQPILATILLYTPYVQKGILPPFFSLQFFYLNILSYLALT